MVEGFLYIYKLIGKLFIIYVMIYYVVVKGFCKYMYMIIWMILFNLMMKIFFILYLFEWDSFFGYIYIFIYFL